MNTSNFFTQLDQAAGTKAGGMGCTMKKKPTTFAAALSAHLASRSLTQRHLAIMIGVTEGMVSNYIAGRREPGAKLIERIGEALEASIIYTPEAGWSIEY